MFGNFLLQVEYGKMQTSLFGALGCETEEEFKIIGKKQKSL